MAAVDVPVHLRPRLTVEHAAVLLDMSGRQLRDLIDWHNTHEGSITLAPGQAPIPVHRAAENGWAYVWRRDIDLAAQRGHQIPDLAGTQGSNEPRPHGDQPAGGAPEGRTL